MNNASNILPPLAAPMAAPMMTLAALAATAPAGRPSGESIELQAQRILNGINHQLSHAKLATKGEWQAVGVGLTPDRANLAYIAQNTKSNAFAICLRGTMFTSLTRLTPHLALSTSAASPLRREGRISI